MNRGARELAPGPAIPAAPCEPRAADTGTHVGRPKSSPHYTARSHGPGRYWEYSGYSGNIPGSVAAFHARGVGWWRCGCLVSAGRPPGAVGPPRLRLVGGGMGAIDTIYLSTSAAWTSRRSNTACHRRHSQREKERGGSLFPGPCSASSEDEVAMLQCALEGETRPVRHSNGPSLFMPRAAAVRGKFPDKHPVYGRTQRPPNVRQSCSQA